MATRFVTQDPSHLPPICHKAKIGGIVSLGVTLISLAALVTLFFLSSSLLRHVPALAMYLPPSIICGMGILGGFVALIIYLYNQKKKPIPITITATVEKQSPKPGQNPPKGKKITTKSRKSPNPAPKSQGGSLAAVQTPKRKQVPLLERKACARQGQSCFINAAMQTMAHLPQMCDLFYHELKDRQIGEPRLQKKEELAAYKQSLLKIRQDVQRNGKVVVEHILNGEQVSRGEMGLLIMALNGCIKLENLSRPENKRLETFDITGGDDASRLIVTLQQILSNEELCDDELYNLRPDTMQYCENRMISQRVTLKEIVQSPQFQNLFDPEKNQLQERKAGSPEFKKEFLKARQDVQRLGKELIARVLKGETVSKEEMGPLIIAINRCIRIENGILSKDQVLTIGVDRFEARLAARLQWILSGEQFHNRTKLDKWKENHNKKEYPSILWIPNYGALSQWEFHIDGVGTYRLMVVLTTGGHTTPLIRDNDKDQFVEINDAPAQTISVTKEKVSKILRSDRWVAAYYVKVD
jgi:hypothetical protein